MSRVIIDGDSYIYKSATTCKELIQLDDNLYYEAYNINISRKYMRELIDTLCGKCNVDDYVIVLGSKVGTNFRYTINPNYKSNRKRLSKPVMLDKVREMVEKEFNTYSIPCIEADDTVRILYESGEGNIIASIDKDLKTFESKIYDSYHDKLTYIGSVQAEANFKRQLLMGDSTDGYTGIPGVGKATADKYLLDGIDIDGIIQLYLDKGLSIDDFKLTYNCAKILGKDDYNNGIIKLYGGEELDVKDNKRQHLKLVKPIS